MNYNNMTFKRRDVLAFPLISIFSASLGACNTIPSNNLANFSGKIASLEAMSGGRIGVFVINDKNNHRFGYRINERFAMCSTFKLPLAAIILHEIKNGRINPGTNIKLKLGGMKPFSPSVADGIAKGEINIIEAAKAAQIYSDNIAANALLSFIGGPSAFTARLRAIGDSVTRLDNYEPDLNFVRSDDVNNTTTPQAFSKTVNAVFNQEFLGTDYYKLLKSWTIETQTGKNRIRASLPGEWVVGDKTGTAINQEFPNYYNDISVVFNNKSNDYIISIFFQSDKYYNEILAIDEAVLSKAAAIVVEYLSLNI